jgi:hypothetical protein
MLLPTLREAIPDDACTNEIHVICFKTYNNKQSTTYIHLWDEVGLQLTSIFSTSVAFERIFNLSDPGASPEQQSLLPGMQNTQRHAHSHPPA